MVADYLERAKSYGHLRLLTELSLLAFVSGKVFLHAWRFLVEGGGPHVSGTSLPEKLHQNPLPWIVKVALVSPVAETVLILVPMFWVAKRGTSNAFVQVAFISLVFAGIHAIGGGAVRFVAVLPSAFFLALPLPMFWSESRVVAIRTAILVHLVSNSLTLVVWALQDHLGVKYMF